jgi:hypothetical protein
MKRAPRRYAWADLLRRVNETIWINQNAALSGGERHPIRALDASAVLAIDVPMS